MKQLIIIVIGLLSVSMMWAGDSLKTAALERDSIENVNGDTIITNIVRLQIKEQLPYLDDLYISKKQIDNEIMKAESIWGIALRTLCVILGIIVIILCLLTIGLFRFYSILRKKVDRNEEKTSEIKFFIRKVERSTQDCSNKVDDIYKEVRQGVKTECTQIISDIQDKNESESMEPEVSSDIPVEVNISDVLGYAEYMGNRKMRLFNSPTEETIYVIKTGKNQNEICFIVDSTKVQKAIKNKPVCLDPLCNIVRGSQQSAVDIRTIHPGVVQLEQGNIYKVLEKAEIELIS